MATDTAAPATPTTRPAPDPTRYVWQVPVFLLGLVVFTAAWRGWLPLGTPDPVGDHARNLVALRTAYERVTPDRDELKDLLGKVAAGVDSFPEHSVAARYALGSGYGRLAELTAAPEEARGYWTLAKQHFDLLRREDIRDPNDAPKFAFRAAKARAAVGFPPNTPPAELRLTIALLSNVPLGEEAGEAGRLAADLALRLSPPDLATAKDSLTRYLTATGVATPAASLARAKLQLGDIHVRRNELGPARKWLEQVGADAPPEVVTPAKAQLAIVRMKEDDWLGATRDWEAVRATSGVSQALRAASAYHLGVCKLNTREPDAAAKLFEEAVKGGGPEATAAAVRLAELDLKSTDPAKRAAAVELLVGAVKGVNAPGEFKNPFVRVAEVRAAFEQAVGTLLADGAFEPAVKAAEGYGAVSEAGREREKRAEALAAWAAKLQKDGGDHKPKALAAAEEYTALAALQPAVTGKADVLRRAAGLYKSAGEPTKAVEVLRGAVKLSALPDATAGPLWVDLAEALIATGSPDVWRAFNEVLATTGDVSTATRYRLARHFADTRDARLAPLGRALFEQIAKQETVGPGEQEYHERALVELAHEFIRAGNFAEAEVWLRKQLGFYAAGPEAPLGRLLLGVCLLQRASAPPPSSPDAATAARLRDEAVKLFKQLVADADAKQKRDGKLGDRDSWLRLQAGLRVLQAYQQMQKPNDLLVDASIMLDRHRGSVEELIILSLVYHAFKQKGETGRALQTRDQMKELFDRLPPAAFTGTAGEYSRAYWEKVWFAPDAK